MRAGSAGWLLLLVTWGGLRGAAPPFDELPLRDTLRAEPDVVATLPDDARARLGARFQAAGAGDTSADPIGTGAPSASALAAAVDLARQARSADALVIGVVGRRCGAGDAGRNADRRRVAAAAARRCGGDQHRRPRGAGAERRGGGVAARVGGRRARAAAGTGRGLARRGGRGGRHRLRERRLAGRAGAEHVVGLRRASAGGCGDGGCDGGAPDAAARADGGASMDMGAGGDGRTRPDGGARGAGGAGGALATAGVHTAAYTPPCTRRRRTRRRRPTERRRSDDAANAARCAALATLAPAATTAARRFVQR